MSADAPVTSNDGLELQQSPGKERLTVSGKLFAEFHEVWLDQLAAQDDEWDKIFSRLRAAILDIPFPTSATGDRHLSAAYRRNGTTGAISPNPRINFSTLEGDPQVNNPFLPPIYNAGIFGNTSRISVFKPYQDQPDPTICLLGVSKVQHVWGVIVDAAPGGGSRDEGLNTSSSRPLCLWDSSSTYIRPTPLSSLVETNQKACYDPGENGIIPAPAQIVSGRAIIQTGITWLPPVAQPILFANQSNPQMEIVQIQRLYSVKPMPGDIDAIQHYRNLIAIPPPCCDLH